MSQNKIAHNNGDDDDDDNNNVILFFALPVPGQRLITIWNFQSKLSGPNQTSMIEGFSRE